jgi:Arc/MetJ-type ribon-helix-helix transcriptional regulator
MMSTRRRVADAVAQPVTEWVGTDAAAVEDGPRTLTAVFSVRMPAEWTDEIIAEVERRGLANPNQLLRALVREGLDRAKTNDAHTPAVTEILSHLDAARRRVIENEHRQAVA